MLTWDMWCRDAYMGHVVVPEQVDGDFGELEELNIEVSQDYVTPSEARTHINTCTCTCIHTSPHTHISGYVRILRRWKQAVDEEYARKEAVRLHEVAATLNLPECPKSGAGLHACVCVYSCMHSCVYI